MKAPNSKMQRMVRLRLKQPSLGRSLVRRHRPHGCTSGKRLNQWLGTGACFAKPSLSVSFDHLVGTGEERAPLRLASLLSSSRRKLYADVRVPGYGERLEFRTEFRTQ